MLDDLSRLLVQLAINPDARREFERNPAGAAALAGLTGNAREAVVSRDPAVIQKAVLNQRGVDIDGVRAHLDSAAAESDVVVVIVI